MTAQELTHDLARPWENATIAAMTTTHPPNPHKEPQDERVFRMKVLIDICTPDGWHSAVYDAPDGADKLCYALTKKACRFEFWEKQTGQTLPRGHAMIWEPRPSGIGEER